MKPLFLDIGDGTRFLDVKRLTPSEGLDSWESLRAALHEPSLWKDFNCVVLDDLTKAEELAAAWVVANVKKKDGSFASSIEGFGYGTGYGHLYETFLLLLNDLDSHIRAGRHVVCIAHECTARVPNPSGENFIRYEPRLQSPDSGKNSIRLRVKEWCDHLLFVGYDVYVSDDGKAKGSGSRTIYCSEMPTHMAKSRTLSEPTPYEKGSVETWQRLFGKKGGA